MPLLDHFHPPLDERRHWEGFHSKWTNCLVDALNESLLPEGYFAEPNVHAGAAVELDVPTFEEQGNGLPLTTDAATATLPARTWSPPAPGLTMPMAFTDTFEVQVYSPKGPMKLVGVIEIVSPANKDRPETRRTFAIKCASLLNQGIGVIIADIVTVRLANLHDEVVRLLPGGDAFLFPETPGLYAAAYRPIRTKTVEKAEVWLNALAVGQPLPVLPLWLSGGPCLRIDLEATYLDACKRLRLVR